MPKINGRMLICERCGASVFVKALEPEVLDGGFTKVDRFEKADGWKTPIDLGELLCPECNEKWKSIVDEFMCRSISNQKDNPNESKLPEVYQRHMD